MAFTIICHIISMVNNDEDFKCSLLELRGKNLGCWCCPEPCHATGSAAASATGAAAYNLNGQVNNYY